MDACQARADEPEHCQLAAGDPEGLAGRDGSASSLPTDWQPSSEVFTFVKCLVSAVNGLFWCHPAVYQLTVILIGIPIRIGNKFPYSGNTDNLNVLALSL